MYLKWGSVEKHGVYGPPTPTYLTARPSIFYGIYSGIYCTFRGSGYALFWVMITELIAADLGYVGEGIRAAMTSPLIQHVWKPNHYISATLHRELYDPKKGYVPNVLIYSPFTMRKDYTEVMKQVSGYLHENALYLHQTSYVVYVIKQLTLANDTCERFISICSDLWHWYHWLC